MPDVSVRRPVRTFPPQLLDVLRMMRPFDQASLSALRAFGENFDPDLLTEVSVRPEAGFDLHSVGCRYHFQGPDGLQVEFCRRGAPHSVIRANLGVGRLSKNLPDGDPWNTLERETYWLPRLPPTVAPRLLARAGSGIELTYEGEMVNPYNLPLDWREQAEAILTALASAGCAHNDIQVTNLVVAGGRLKLIDFGWATRIGERIPSHWPEILGMHHRLGVHHFDDRHALFAALGIIERLAMEQSG